MALGLIDFIKGYIIFTIIILLAYSIRHLLFTFNRMYYIQRIYYSDLYNSENQFVSVLIPMHNEEATAKNVLSSLLKSDYDHNKLEIIPINDNSTDDTKKILDKMALSNKIIKPLHRDCENRGKPAALNDAMKIAKGEIIIIFDADYIPSVSMISKLAKAFYNHEIGAVMGRVVPLNYNRNLLTRLLSMERSAGYQVDQQARFNLRLIPQYGGTVGGFRKNLILESGGFNEKILAEDTELTFRLITMGYKVTYANGAECYEESPEKWTVRGKQVRRWSRGHNAVLFKYLSKVLISKYLLTREKVDGVFLLGVYVIPVFFLLALISSVALFFLGEMNIFFGWWAILFISGYNSFGNFAPFYQIATGLMLDGTEKDVMKLPLMMFSYFFYLINISLGFLDAVFDILPFRKIHWAKTERFNKSEREKV